VNRYELSMPEYEQLTELNCRLAFGCKDFEPDFQAFQHIYRRQYEGRNLLVMQRISGYHRQCTSGRELRFEGKHGISIHPRALLRQGRHSHDQTGSRNTML